MGLFFWRRKKKAAESKNSANGVAESATLATASEEPVKKPQPELHEEPEKELWPETPDEPKKEMQQEVSGEPEKKVSTETARRVPKPGRDRELVELMTQRMLGHIREEIPEHGKFETRSVTFYSGNVGGAFEGVCVWKMGIIIEPDARVEDCRWMTAAVTVRGSDYVRMAHFLKGTNQEIVEYLSRPEFYEEITQLFVRLDRGMKKFLDD